MGKRKAAAADEGIAGTLKYVGKVIVFFVSFGMLCPNIFDPGTDDVASKEAQAERGARKA